MAVKIGSKEIEFHQWANSLLLIMVGFFVSATYFEIKEDHKTLEQHETRITVLERLGGNMPAKEVPQQGMATEMVLSEPFHRKHKGAN